MVERKKTKMSSRDEEIVRQGSGNGIFEEVIDEFDERRRSVAEVLLKCCYRSS